jgi:glycosyltransferase involved in cell wall biosynthesis
MGPRKVLQLSTYPIRPRVSGGQRRAGAICDAYRRAGIDVQYVTILEPAAFPETRLGPTDFPIGPRARAAAAAQPYLPDLLHGELFDLDPECRDPLVQFWKRFDPDMVQLEHCFLWPGVRRLFADGAVRRVPVVYSSHNHEAAMKAGIYARVLPPDLAADAAARVREAEANLARSADLVVAVSASDAAVFSSLGARRLAVVRNGSDRVTASPVGIAKWERVLFAGLTRSFVLFVSSNHVPNYVGFEQMVGTSLAFLPPDACIVVAGGVGEHMARQPAFAEGAHLNRSRLRLLGKGLSDDDLAALTQLANAVLLPITDGGGSNIKTVEALLSGRPVIATPFALRSYEEFRSLERLTVCGEPASFRAAAAAAVRQPRLPSALPEPALDAVTWPSLGDEFCARVRDCFAAIPTEGKRAA